MVNSKNCSTNHDERNARKKKQKQKNNNNSNNKKLEKIIIIIISIFEPALGSLGFFLDSFKFVLYVIL